MAQTSEVTGTVISGSGMEVECRSSCLICCPVGGDPVVCERARVAIGSQLPTEPKKAGVILDLCSP